MAQEPDIVRNLSVSFQAGLTINRIIAEFWQESQRRGDPWYSVTFRQDSAGRNWLERFRHDDIEKLGMYELDKQWLANYFSKLKFVPDPET